MLPVDGFRWVRPDRGQRRTGVVVAVLSAGVVLIGCGGTKHTAPTAADPVVRDARATLAGAPSPPSAYRGPTTGPAAQPRALVVFVAADLTNGAIAGVARGAQQAAGAIGWPLQVVDGQGTVQGQSKALTMALRERPGGIILGGVDAARQQAGLREARLHGVPVVGWQAAPGPGPSPKLGLFTNVTADPALVASLAADDAIARSDGTAGVVIFTDSEYAIDTHTSNLMASDIRKCRRCSVLAVLDTPIATATIGATSLVTALLQRFGGRWSYLLAVNGAYIDGARNALIGAGRSGNQPPFSISAGDGDESEFTRIRADEYQVASVAEPLSLQGWQLIDELNRARAGRPPSGYIAPPRLITQADVPNGAVFDPPSGYRGNYLHIWGR